METYREYCDRKTRVYNEFANKYIFWAFNDEQFAEGMRELGLNIDDTDKICHTYLGGYILRERAAEHKELIDKLDKELKELMQNYDFAVDAFCFELANHEYCITYDCRDALGALDLTIKDVNENPTLRSALRYAKEKYLANYDW